MGVELLFNIKNQGQAALDQISAAIRKITDNSGLAGQSLTNLEGNVKKAFDSMGAAGLNYEQILKRLAKSGDEIGRGVAGGAKEAIQALKEQAEAAKNLANAQTKLQSQANALQAALTNPFQALTQSAGKAFAALGTGGVIAVGAAAGMAVLGKATFDLVSEQAQWARQILNTSSMMGISVQQTVKLSAETKLLGLNMGTIAGSARFLDQALEDSSGSGAKATKIIQSLGVSLQDSAGNARETGDVLADLITSLGGVEDKTKRTYDAYNIFGRFGARSLLPIIDQQKEVVKSLQDLGYNIDENLIKKLAATDQKINETAIAWNLFKTKLAGGLTVPVNYVLSTLTNVMSDSPGGIRNPEDYAQHVMGGASAQQQLALANSRGIGLAPDLAQGKAITDADNARRAKTPEGIRQSLKDVQEQLKEIRSALSKGGLDSATAGKTVGQEVGLEAQEKRLQDQLSADKKDNSLAERLPDLIAKAQAERDRKGAVNPYASVDETQAAQLKESPGSASQINRLATINRSTISDAIIRKAQEDTGKFVTENAKALADQMKTALSIMSGEFHQNVRQSDQDTEKAGKATAAQYNETYIDPAEEKIKRQFSLAGRVASLQSDGSVSGEAKGADTAYAQRIAQAEQLLDLEKQRMVFNETADQQAARNAKDIDAFEKESDAAKQDRLITYLEIQKKGLEESKQQAGELYNALYGGGKGVQQFFQDQLKKMGQNLFEAAVGPAIQSMGAAVGGVGGSLGNTAFKGTIFENKSATGNERALDANTAAVNANTAAHEAPASGGNGSPDTGASAVYEAQSAGIARAAVSVDSVATPIANNTVALDKLAQATVGLYQQLGGTGSIAGISVPASGTAIGSGNNPLDVLTGTATPSTTASAASGGATGVAAFAGPILAALSVGGAISSALRPPGASLPTYSASGEHMPSNNAVLSGVLSGGAGALIGLGSMGAIGGSSTSAPGWMQSISGVMKGFSSGVGSAAKDAANGNLLQDLTGSAGGYGGSVSQEIGGVAGAAGAVFGQAQDLVHNLKVGGARGAVGDVGDVASTAAMFDPEPISHAILQTVGMGASLLKAIMPDPKQWRQQQEQYQMEYQQWIAPATINQNIGSSGTQNRYNALGQIQSTNFDTVQIQNGYQYVNPKTHQVETMQGTVLQSYQTAPTEPAYIAKYNPANVVQPVVVQVQTMDSKSFNDNASQIATATQKAMLAGHPLNRTIQASARR